MSWRKILSITSAAGSISFGTALLSSWGSGLPFALRIAEYIVLVVVLATAINAVPLWLGKLWALLVLKIVAVFGILLAIFMCVAQYFEYRAGLGDQSIVSLIGIFVFVLTVPSFFAAVAFHPTVKAEFRSQNRAAA